MDGGSVVMKRAGVRVIVKARVKMEVL